MYKYLAGIFLLFPFLCFGQRHGLPYKVALQIKADSVLFCDYIIFDGSKATINLPPTDAEVEKKYRREFKVRIIEATPAKGIRFEPLVDFLKKKHLKDKAWNLPIKINDFIVYPSTANIYLTKTSIDSVRVRADTLRIFSKTYASEVAQRKKRQGGIIIR